MRAARLYVAILGVMLAAFAAQAQDRRSWSGLPTPRYESLAFDEVNGRMGPSFDHPVMWTYHREGLPVMVVQETEMWRKVRDPDGDEAWVHKRTLSQTRTVVVKGGRGRAVALRLDSSPGAEIVALAQGGAVLQRDWCFGGWCRVSSGRYSGWVEASALWGVETPALQAR